MERIVQIDRIGPRFTVTLANTVRARYRGIARKANPNLNEPPSTLNAAPTHVATGPAGASAKASGRCGRAPIYDACR